MQHLTHHSSHWSLPLKVETFNNFKVGVQREVAHLEVDVDGEDCPAEVL